MSVTRHELGRDCCSCTTEHHKKQVRPVSGCCAHHHNTGYLSRCIRSWVSKEQLVSVCLPLAYPRKPSRCARYRSSTHRTDYCSSLMVVNVLDSGMMKHAQAQLVRLEQSNK